MRHAIFSVLIGTLAIPSSHAVIPAPRTARALIYEANTQRQKPLFRYVRTEKLLPNGVLHVQSVFADMDGAPVYNETAESKDGKAIEYRWDHHQLAQTGSVKVRSGKVHYSITTQGKSKSAVTDAPENLVLGPTMITYLQKHWDKLASEKGVEIRIGVPDRMTDYGFRFKRVQDEIAAKDGIAQITLEPTNFFVSLAVAPLVFIFTEDGSRLIAMKGMSLLKVRKGKAWVDLVAETIFE